MSPNVVCRGLFLGHSPTVPSVREAGDPSPLCPGFSCPSRQFTKHTVASLTHSERSRCYQVHLPSSSSLSRFYGQVSGSSSCSTSVLLGINQHVLCISNYRQTLFKLSEWFFWRLFNRLGLESYSSQLQLLLLKLWRPLKFRPHLSPQNLLWQHTLPLNWWESQALFCSKTCMRRELFHIYVSSYLSYSWLSFFFQIKIMLIRSPNLLKDIISTGREICNAHSNSSMEVRIDNFSK